MDNEHISIVPIGKGGDMIELLGEQEIWENSNRSLSNKMKAKGMTGEEVTQLLSSDVILDKIAELCFASRIGTKSATTPEVAALIPKGWTLIEDVPSVLSPVRKLEFLSFLQSGEKHIGGETMRARAPKLEGNLGLADAAFMLENQEMIPTEFRGAVYLVFPGTLLRGSGGSLRVPGLSWDGGRWILIFCWLGSHWYGLARLVSSCK